MNILLITYKFPPHVGGVSSSSYRIAKSYIRKGHHVLVIDLGGKVVEGIKPTFYDGFKIIRDFEWKNRENFTLLSEFILNNLKNIRFDFIHSIYFYPSSFLGFLISRKLKIPHMASGRGNDVDKLFFTREYFPTIYHSLKNSEVVTAVSSDMKSFLEGVLGREVIFIENGFSPDISLKDVAYKRRKRIFRIGFSGELREKKGMEVILKALKILKEKNVKFKFLIVGDVRKEEVNLFKLLLKKYRLRNLVEITGFLRGKDYIRNLLDMDIFLHPSLRDGMPNSVIEAMYYKIPVLGTDVGGIKDLLKDGRGIIVPYGDSEAIAEKILDLLKRRKSFESMVEKAHNYVVENLTPEREINSFLKSIGGFL